MKTVVRTAKPYEKEALRLAREVEAAGERRPLRFWKVMRQNRGIIDRISPYGPSEDGLDRKNPVVAALGDSVTAGHFEYTGNREELFRKVDAGLLEEQDALEITDARECYLEKFRLKLIEKYQQTSVSTINSGIAGDSICGMQKRLYRDVIRYQPDLILINGSLNWGEEQGDTEDYRRVLVQVVKALKEETKGDIVLMTPNMVLPSSFDNKRSALEERVEVIRGMAESEEVCLADTYKVWEAYQAAGYPLKELLSNELNHPTVTGHEMYAVVLMQLMEERRVSS